MDTYLGDAPICRLLSHFMEVTKQPLDKSIHSLPTCTLNGPNEMPLIPLPTLCHPCSLSLQLETAYPEMLSLKMTKGEEERKRTNKHATFTGFIA